MAERPAIDIVEEPELQPAVAAAPAVAVESTPLVRAATDRVAMFDAMRVVAAFSVVLMHTPQGGPWDPIARAQRFGPALFTTAAIILLSRSLQRRPDQAFGTYSLRRIHRLGLPLVLWSLIYAGFYWLNQRFLGGRNDVDFGVGFLLGGASIHLWFLPFLLIVGILAFPVLKFVQYHPETRYWLAAVLLLCMVASLFIPQKYPDFDRGVRIFLEQSVWSVPTAFAGLAIAIVIPKRIPESATPFIFAIGGAIFVAASYASYRGIKSPVIQLAKAFAVTGIALAPWSPWIVRKLATLGTLSFGVYLVHFMYVTALRELGKRVASPTEIWFYPAIVVVAFVLSYATAIAANRTKWGKVLFP